MRMASNSSRSAPRTTFFRVTCRSREIGEENMVRDEGHAVDAIVRRVQGRGGPF